MRYFNLAENRVLINGVNLLYTEVLTRLHPLFDLKVLKNDRFLSDSHKTMR